ncbi:MAG: FMN-binding negative transcriptional regulator [Phycisphaerales bacterium JB043]
MTYPPAWRHTTDTGDAIALMRERPVAHLITSHTGLHATRLPFLCDVDSDRSVRLRSHLNAQNPQAQNLDEANVLVVFPGPATYVSPHWRGNLNRAGTIDYEEVRVRGVARTIDDIDLFRQFIDELVALIEPRYSEVGDYPLWQTSMTPEGYVERFYQAITMFEIDIESVEMISKLHQTFTDEERRSVAEHLARSNKEDARAIGDKIRMQLDT